MRHPRLLPASATADARLVVAARAVRAFGDGFVSVLLPLYLLSSGMSPLQVGAISTATLVGSAALTMVVGLVTHRFGRRLLLLLASGLMVATGLLFSAFNGFWPLMIVAFIGTLNPSSGDVSVFLPLEQSLLPQTVSDRHRTELYAWYGFLALTVAALGALCAGLPGLLGARLGWNAHHALQSMFVLYALLGVVAFTLYRPLSAAVEIPPTEELSLLRQSRRIVFGLAALFSLDSFGGGFIAQSLLALWLFERFHVSAAGAGAIFFCMNILSATSQLLAPVIARQVGLIAAMVITHLPANILLLMVPFMPNLPLAVALLLVRSIFGSMDVPARNSYVMSVVPVAERPAAASVTAVPRSLATSASPLLSGFMLGVSAFGWPLVVAGGLKAVYDVLLFASFSRIHPPEEMQSIAAAAGPQLLPALPGE